MYFDTVLTPKTTKWGVALDLIKEALGGTYYANIDEFAFQIEAKMCL